MTLTIRPAVAADAALVLDFIRQLATWERLLHEVVADEEAVRASLFADDPAAEVAIAELDGLPVGFALWFPTYSTFLARRGLHLEDLFVAERARGHGVGRALLAHVAAVAVARGCGRLEWSVLDWNESAIGFYRRLGARPMDEWTTWRVDGIELSDLAASR